ncbi:MAG: YoaK family protein [Victivallaceae bacterium]|nr:YoaK family protein [Victivallaceae bacterium]
MTSTAATEAHAERLAAACLLSTVGGFLDIYTYLYRGRVFANAATGNLVLFGLNLAELNWMVCAKYLLAIISYAAGVFAAEAVHRHLPESRRLGWHQAVLLIEVICLLPVVLVPHGNFDFAVNAVVSFVCALQVQTFRRMNGLPFASTMCTGNLRSGTEALFRRFSGQSSGGDLRNAFRYYLVIVCFIAGAAVGTALLRTWGEPVFVLAPLGLIAVFFLIVSKRQYAMLRRRLTGRRDGKTAAGRAKP